jgi:hypothetical protein
LLITTSFFDGREDVVRVAWLNGKGNDVEYMVRLLFRACDDRAIESALARVAGVW